MSIPASLAHGVFVTGTDTEVGKSLIAAALIHRYNASGQPCIGMKPVAAGADWRQDDAGGYWHNDDVALLDQASPIRAPQALRCPYLFEPPIAPHVAARQAGVQINLDTLRERYLQLRDYAPTVVVEGAGGWLVPVDDKHTLADLAVALRLPVVLVVGLRLGCISHALLTAQAIAASGLPLAGWVANHIDPQMLVQQDNIATLQQRLQAPCLGIVPRLETVDVARAAGYLGWPAA
ncbi:dethiobiotin synthase [Brachymonas sp. G13]|uniref:dethiobiotin synthase n=1 Tax=Brachymonas wangyanguii TaxID=3130163 RepID=UPI00307E5EF7